MTELEKIQKLSNKFLLIDRMDQVDEQGEPVSFNTAYTIVEIVSSLKKLEKTLDLLENERNAEKIEDIVHEIGEELRHIKYHIEDSKYYSYI